MKNDIFKNEEEEEKYKDKHNKIDFNPFLSSDKKQKRKQKIKK